MPGPRFEVPELHGWIRVLTSVTRRGLNEWGRCTINQCGLGMEHSNRAWSRRQAFAGGISFFQARKDVYYMQYKMN